MHGKGRWLKGLKGEGRKKGRKERKKEGNSYTEFTEGGTQRAQRKTKLETGARYMQRA